ncbi:ComEC family competence protein [Cyclobacteriaceae bacterium]|nr:ComEC family competence protein [Cyclobacteriaceae bacterium]
MSLIKISPLFKILLLFILGIVSNLYFPQYTDYTTFVGLILFIVYVTFVFLFNKGTILRSLITLSFLGFIFSFGSTYYQEYKIKRESHLSQNVKAFSGEVNKIIKEDSNTVYFELIVDEYFEHDEWYFSHNKEKVLVYLSDVDNTSISVGDQFLIDRPLYQIKPPSSPFGPDFKEIYKDKNIHFRVFISHNDIRLLSQRGSYLTTYKDHFIDFLQTHFSPTEAGFLAALLTNSRQHLPKEVKQMINTNGVSHLMAISGLHIGVLYGLMVFLLSFLNRNQSKVKSVLCSLLIITILVLYGFICDWTSSVSRSIFMFAVLELARLTNKKTNSLNNLYFAAFVLLLINPNSLFDIGFQLSFTGVFSIMVFYPILENIWPLEKPWQQYILDLFLVTISAQVGVTPLLLYYFGSFTVNSILLSVVLVPITGFVLITGVLLMIVYLIPVINIILVWVCKSFIYIFFTLLEWSNDYLFIYEPGKLSILNIIFCYIVIWQIFSFIKSSRIATINAVLASSILYVGVVSFISPLYYESKKLIVYEQEGELKFALKAQNKLEQIDEPIIAHNFHIIDSLVFEKMNNINTISNIDYIYIYKNTPIQMIINKQPQCVFISKDLKYNYRKRLKNRLQKAGITYHDGKKQGYLTL